MEPQDRELLSRAVDVLEEQNEHAARVEEQDERAARVELVKALRPAEPDHRAQAEAARVFIAKAERAQHDRALAALGARDGGSAPLAKSASPGDLAALARLAQHMELRERIVREHAAIRERPEHATSWLYNPPSGSVDETVRMVEQLAAAG